MLGKLNMDEFRDGLVERDELLWQGHQSLAAQGLERFAGARRLLRRLGRPRSRRASVPAPPRPIPAARYASPRPSPGLSASSPPMAAARVGDRRLRLITRPGGADRARTSAMPRSCSDRWPAMDPKDTTSVSMPRCPTMRRSSAGRSRASRSASQRNIASWHPEGHRCLVAEGCGVAERAGAEIIEISLPHNEVRASCLLHRGAR